MFIANELKGPLEYATRKGIAHALMYGDTGHHPRMSYEAHTALLSVIDAYPNITFHFILGNHDMYGDDPNAGHALELLQRANRSNVRVYTKPTKVKLEGAKVNFLPFPHCTFDKVALNVAHLPVQGSRMDTGSESKSTVSSTAVIVSGDLHTSQQVRNTYYSGTLYQTRFGEKPEKFFHDIHFINEHDYTITLVPHTPAITLQTLVVNSPDDLQDIPEDSSVMYRLIINDGADIVPEHYSHLQIVQQNTFKTKQELQSIMQMKHAEGESIRIDVPEFLEAFFVSTGVAIEQVDRLMSLRKSVLQAYSI